MHTVPIEVQTFILYHLDPSSLKAAFQVSKFWNHTIQQDPFPQTYAQTRTANEMKALTPKLFEKLLPCFSPAQLFCIDEKKITRHTMQPMAETASNQLNLRIVKLLSSLDWYQEIFQKNKDKLIPMWCGYYNTKELHAKLFEETFEYMHLFRLGSGSWFKDHIDDKKINQALTINKPITAIKRSGWDTLSPYEDIMTAERLCVFDYAALHQVNAKVLDDLFQAIFSRYRITHLKYPNGNSSGYFGMSTVFFKGLLAALTSQCLKTRTEDSLEPMDVSLEAPAALFPGKKWRVHSSQTKSADDLLDNYLSMDGFKTLKLYVNNDETLECLRKWILTTQITIEQLKIFIGRPNHTITVEGLKAFGESLLQSHVKSIHFLGHLYDENLSNLCNEISNSLNTQRE
jgi:hypothetical protein